MTIRDPRWGFRFSAFDVGVLAAASLGIAATCDLPIVPWSLAITSAHFFLFCNVVRLRITFELLWAAAFVGIVVGLTATGEPRLLAALLLIAPFTAGLVILEVKSSCYHGAWADRLNPSLDAWLKRQPPR